MMSLLNNSRRYFIYFISILFLPLNLFSQDVVKVKSGDRLFIGKSIEYFIDTTNELMIQEVMDKPFVKSTTDILNLGHVASNVWTRFNVVSENEREVFLEINAPLIQQLEIFEVKENKVLNLFKGGAGLSFGQRPIHSENWLIDIKLDPGEKTALYIKGQSYYPYQIPIVISSKNKFVEDSKRHYLFWGIYMGVMLFAFIYNFFIYLSIKERSYLYYLIYIVSSMAFYLGLSGFGFWLFWSDSPIFNPMVPIFVSITNCVIILFTFDFLQIDKKQKGLYYTGCIFFVIFVILAIMNLLKMYEIALNLSQLMSLLICFYFITAGFISLKNGVATAKYCVLAWTLFLIMVVVFILTLNNVLPTTFFTTHGIFIGHMTEVALLSFALADKINKLKKENELSQLRVIESLREKEKMQLELNQELEGKVKERTFELEKTITNLKEAQNQLVQAEKMASLGQLTAGIAHEIQNPLNFVNNFADINRELLEDLKNVVKTGNHEEIDDIISNLTDNENKVLHHGGRASSIVKGMLQHSRTRGNNKEKINLNTLCDEYGKLAFAGFKGNDNSLEMNFMTEFDPNVKEMMIYPQDIGRTILNFLNNAFYAATIRYSAEKERGVSNPEKPIVKLSTHMENDRIFISVMDNGQGVPNEIKDKIFQPFFTTKPTGKGTGLGLSLSYDIINAHGGEILVDSEEGKGTTFTISIPFAENRKQ